MFARGFATQNDVHSETLYTENVSRFVVLPSRTTNLTA